MARGKQTCKILKEIRRQIAEANGIEFATSECRYKGDCLGTCPKCEAEVRYLEQQLRARSLAGKAVAVAGISAASLAMLMPISAEGQTQQECQAFMKGNIPAMTDTITVKGIVLSGDTLPDGGISKEPLIGATISNKRTALGAITNLDGHFGLPACVGDTLKVEYVGYEPQTIVVTEDIRNVEINLAPSQALLGEMVLAGIMPYATLREKHYLDFNIIDEKGNPINPEHLDISIVKIDEDCEEYSDYLYHEFIDEQHPCRIYWDVSSNLQDEDGKPLKEATLRIEAEGYDDPVTIKVKYPKRNAKKTIKFKHKKNVNAQERILPEEERLAKLDSIIAETERHFGWNDDAYSAKDKYGAKAFKKMKYDENGVATITLPVMYIALGKAVEQSDKDEIVIKELLGCTPSTSLEFLYCGNKYYIPLSCNNDIEKTPAENELIEVTIRVFNPKVFHYSRKTIPYPYCIVESINLLR